MDPELAEVPVSGDATWGDHAEIPQAVAQRVAATAAPAPSAAPAVNASAARNRQLAVGATTAVGTAVGSAFLGPLGPVIGAAAGGIARLIADLF